MPATQGNIVKPNDLEELMDTITIGVDIAMASPNQPVICSSLTAWTWTKPSTGALAVDTLITNAEIAYQNAKDVVWAACSGDNSAVNSTRKSGNNSDKNSTVKNGKTSGYKYSTHHNQHY